MRNFLSTLGCIILTLTLLVFLEAAAKASGTPAAVDVTGILLKQASFAQTADDLIHSGFLSGVLCFFLSGLFPKSR